MFCPENHTPNRKWTDLPHPFTATEPICRNCGGYGRVFDTPDGFSSTCETCCGSGLAEQVRSVAALESAAD